MIYHNCVHQGDVYYINQICQEHILIPKPSKCLFMYQLKFTIIVTNIVSNIYRTINKFLSKFIFLLDKDYYKVIYFLSQHKRTVATYFIYVWKLFVKIFISHPFQVKLVHFADAPTYCVARLRMVSTVFNFTKGTHTNASKKQHLAHYEIHRSVTKSADSYAIRTKFQKSGPWGSSPV